MVQRIVLEYRTSLRRLGAKTSSAPRHMIWSLFTGVFHGQGVQAHREGRSGVGGIQGWGWVCPGLDGGSRVIGSLLRGSAALKLVVMEAQEKMTILQSCWFSPSAQCSDAIWLLMQE